MFALIDSWTKITCILKFSLSHCLQSISGNFSLKDCELRCEVQKFISEFASWFVNQAFDWLH